MIWSVIIYTPILLALAWAFGWLAMVLVVVAFGLGIGVGAAWEDEQRGHEAAQTQPRKNDGPRDRVDPEPYRRLWTPTCRVALMAAPRSSQTKKPPVRSWRLPGAHGS